MLTHLSIQNFTLVEKLDLDMKPGMTVITGETGAGKSILLDALGQTLGDRAEADRTGGEIDGGARMAREPAGEFASGVTGPAEYADCDAVGGSCAQFLCLMTSCLTITSS